MLTANTPLCYILLLQYLSSQRKIGIEEASQMKSESEAHVIVLG